MHVFLLTVLIEAASCDSHVKTNHQLHGSTIVHLFEWKWKDIADECERFLAPKGYGAIQVSPPSENLIMHLKHLNNTRPWYERYRPMSYRIITRSGNEEEFVDMTTRCNKVGVRIYADVVLNHMAGDYDTNVGTAGSTADFEKYDYPSVPYNREHFHEACSINFNIAKQVRECQIDGTKDINHKNKHVQNQIVDYLQKLLELGVAGFRVDAAKHIWPEDLRAIYSQLEYHKYEHLSRSKPYIYHEVTYNATGEAVKPFEYTEIGDVTDYRVGEELKNLFRGYYALKLLRTWGPQWGLLPSENAVISIDNHETQREDDVLNYKEAKAYKAAVAFILAHPYGRPRVMSSYYFDKWEEGPPSDEGEHILSPHSNETCGNGWVCEHRWRQIYQMVIFRNAVRGTNVTHWWDNGNNLVAFSRGDKGFIAFNLEEGKDMKATIRTALPSGSYCDVISGQRDQNLCTGRKVTVTAQKDGWTVVDIRIPAHDEDTHIAIHVGPESSLQTEWTSDTVRRPPVTLDDGLSRKTSPCWSQEHDPLPPLTSEIPTTESWKKEEEQNKPSTRKHLWNQEHDPLPPLTRHQPRIVISGKEKINDIKMQQSNINTEEKKTTLYEYNNQEFSTHLKLTSHYESWRRDPISSTSAQAMTMAWKEKNKNRHRERDPLPPLASQPLRIVTWKKEKKKSRSTIHKQRWHQDASSSRSKLARTIAMKKMHKKYKTRQSSHRWSQERDPLPPVTRSVTWEKKENMRTQSSHRWRPERDPLPPATPQQPRSVTWEKKENLPRQTGRQQCRHKEDDTARPLTSGQLRSAVSEKQEKYNIQTNQQQRWHQERDPLPPVTLLLPKLQVWVNHQKKDKHTTQQQLWLREHDPLPALTSAIPKTAVQQNYKKKGMQTGSHQQHQHRHQKRDPLPTESAIVVSLETQEEKGWKSGHRWYEHHDSILFLTSPPVRTATLTNQEAIGRKMNRHCWHRERELSSSPLKSDIIVAWKIRRKKRQSKLIWNSRGE